jgi:hypothetical protein
LGLLCLLSSHVLSAEPPRHRAGEPLERILSVDNITPRGRYYEASVPDTLDLSERARLAVHALTEALNPDSGYGPYGHTFFKVQPPYMTESMYAPNMDAGKANWGKIMEALVLLRSVCGSDLNLQIESRSLQGMIGYVDTVGCPYQCSRVLMTLMELHRQHATPELRELIQRLASRLHNHVQHTGNLAAYQDPEPKLQDSRSGINNYEVQTHQHSGPIWALCQWHDLAGNSRDLELAGKLSRFVSQPRFWEPEVEPKFFTGADRGHFKGHIHSYVGALIGMLEYADRANDAWLREFVRNGYEYVRNVGIARIGALGETCTIGDMTVLAAELSRMGIGDYWDHVDQYVRNHLSEMQLVDQDLVARCVSVMPRADELPEGPQDADIVQTRRDCVLGKDSTRRVVERNLGTFFSDGGHPAKIPRHNWSYTICCQGNGAKGLYYAWNSILDHDGKVARINLLLNRASPWLDIDSYLPYEGKVVIRNKTADRILVRMPLWVNKKAVSSKVNGQTAMPFWNGRYAIFEQLKGGDTLVMEFAVVESTETYTLKWNQSDCWFESNWAQRGWKTANEKYVCKFKGNTLVEITPVAATITDGLGYPLYRREHMKAHEAPTKTVKRFVMECRSGKD